MFIKKIQLYAILLLLFSTTGCKKEAINNPDIEDAVLDVFLENTEPLLTKFKEVNITGEGDVDFSIGIDNQEDAGLYYIDLYAYDSKYEFLGYYDSGDEVIKNMEKDTDIQPSDTIWGPFSPLHYLILNSDDGSVVREFGFTDIGDQYIAFRKKNSAGGYFYGWMLVNIERSKKVTIKEYALHKIADTPIKAGEK
jgi:hypothetical protein